MILWLIPILPIIIIVRLMMERYEARLEEEEEQRKALEKHHSAGDYCFQAQQESSRVHGKTMIITGRLATCTLQKNTIDGPHFGQLLDLQQVSYCTIRVVFCIHSVFRTSGDADRKDDTSRRRGEASIQH